MTECRRLMRTFLIRYQTGDRPMKYFLPPLHGGKKSLEKPRKASKRPEEEEQEEKKNEWTRKREKERERE